MFTPVLTRLDQGEALRYMGCPPDPPPPETQALLDRGEAAVLAAAAPRCAYLVLPLDRGTIPGCVFQPQGADIAALLANCGQVILLCATLGAGIDRLLLQAEARDMALALAMDALASAAVESVCDSLEAHLTAQWAAKGLFLTDRFSPGYGDMPLSQQSALCAALDAQRQIGLTVSSAGLLIPRKSVTALIGIAPRPQPKRGRDCQQCAAFQNCPYRKEGKTCGN